MIQLIQLLSSLVLALKLPVLVPKDPPLRVTFYFCIFRIYIFPEFVIHKAVSAYGDWTVELKCDDDDDDDDD